MDIELLKKFLSGRCSDQEARLVKDALDKDPRILTAYMDAVANEPVEAGMPVNMEKALLASLPGANPRKSRVRRLWWSAAAAAVVGIVLTGWLAGIFSASHDYAVLEAGAGSIAQVVLPDHSTLWLKPGSRVRFDQKAYGKERRVIEMEKGEAFFDVTHNAGCPFVVRTGEVSTTDIGTSFDVNMAPGAVVVTVATGEVKVDHNRAALGHLLPGNVLQIDSVSGVSTRRMLPAWMASVWKENHLQLKNASFDELAMAIQQFYGVRLRTTEDRILRQTFTIQLNRKSGAEEVIKVICLFNQNQYRIGADGSYLIY